MTTKLPKWVYSNEEIRKRYMEIDYEQYHLDKLFASLRINKRLLSLFSIATARQHLFNLKKGIFQQAIIAAELFADGKISCQKIRNLHNSYRKVINDDLQSFILPSKDQEEIYRILICLTSRFAYILGTIPIFSQRLCAEDMSQLDKMREVQANFLASVVDLGWTFNPDWRTDTSVAIAKTIYDNHEFSGVPILADALEEAGCTEQELLSSMRNPNSHWCRGSHILDELLSKR